MGSEMCIRDRSTADLVRYFGDHVASTVTKSDAFYQDHDLKRQESPGKSPDDVIHMQETPASPVLSVMKLNLHATRRTPHGGARLVQGMSDWSVKTRRAPSRHCTDARAYGYATTVVHGNGYSRPTSLYWHSKEKVACLILHSWVTVYSSFCPASFLLVLIRLLTSSFVLARV